MPDPAPLPAGEPQYIALTGNPNCGKTTIFNALTGLRAKIGNYAGVTVERKEGRLRGIPGRSNLVVLDLPGTYSLSPKSLDERVSRDVLLHRLPGVPAPQVVVVVVDAANLQRNLYYATQVIELGYPTIVALNMMDVAEQNGLQVSESQLEKELGVPVVPLIASTRDGLEWLRDEIVNAMDAGSRRDPPREFCQLPPTLRKEVALLASHLAAVRVPVAYSLQAAALLWLVEDHAGQDRPSDAHGADTDTVRAARGRLEAGGLDWRSTIIEARYARVSEIYASAVVEVDAVQETFSDRLDRLVTHRIWGMVIFMALMALVFQSIFVFARTPMEFLAEIMDHLGGWVGAAMPPGALSDLLVNGVIKGVGSVLVFLPQILFLFFFLCLLEDSGYMARAAFIMDRLMSKVGLHGKSFIPMLSSFACAIPGIMSARTVENPKDRLVTILIAPLMSCSARLPVYTLLIAACIPQIKVGKVIPLPGLVLFSAYFFGVVAALVMAWIFKKTILRASVPLLIMELPPYKRPMLTAISRHMWDRSKLFLTQAGTVILGMNILLWFLVSYPKSPEVSQKYAALRAQAIARQFSGATNLVAHPSGPSSPGSPLAGPAQLELSQLAAGERSEQLLHSFAGSLGRAIEPAIAPLGFDWKIGIGIISSFAAREVFISTMSVVYSAPPAAVEGETSAAGLVKVLQAQRRADGSAMYTPLTGITLIVFYMFALQCASTVVVVRRETNSWQWPLIQWIYLAVLAWTLSFLVHHLGRWLGWG